MVEAADEIIQHLKSQQIHYEAMRAAVEMQTGFIQSRDVGGLIAGTAEVRGIMRKIRDLEAKLRPLRQTWSTLGHERRLGSKTEIQDLVEILRAKILQIQEIKGKNQELLEGSMASLQKDLGQMKSKSKAAIAYHHRPKEDQARFIDRSN